MSELLTFRPRRGFKVSPRYLSRILAAYGGEQRLSLRPTPRTVLELSFELSGGEIGDARRMARRVASAGGRFLFPDWRVFQVVDIQADVTGFNLAFASYFTPGGKAAIVTSAGDFLERDVVSVVGSTVTLNEGTSIADPEGAILPLFDCVAINSFSFDVISGDFATLSVSAISDDVAVQTTAIARTYNGTEVFTGPRYRTEGVNETVIRPQVFIDDGTGPIAVEPTRLNLEGSLSLMIEGSGLDDLTEAEAFFARRLGRVKPFFLALETEDLEIHGSIAAPAGGLLVVTKSTSSDLLSQRLAIDLADGSRHHCEVTGVNEVAEGTELTLSPARPASDPIAVTELAYCRCDSDEFVFEFNNLERFTVSAQLKRLDHEL